MVGHPFFVVSAHRPDGIINWLGRMVRARWILIQEGRQKVAVAAQGAGRKTRGPGDQDELSDSTLEFMLFRESLFDKRFMLRLDGVVDYNWYRTPELRLMARRAASFFKEHGELTTPDLMKSMLEKVNSQQTIDSQKVDVARCMYLYNAARNLDLGRMSDRDRIAKIERFVKRAAMRQALMQAAGDLDHDSTDDIVGNCLKRFDDIQNILFEEVDFGLQIAPDTIDQALDEHMKFLASKQETIPTGWLNLDAEIRGGLLRTGRSLYVFMGSAGLGKSNVLVNLGVNFLRQNLKVLVVTLEMSQNVYMRRFDSMITGMNIDHLGEHVDVLRDELDRFFKVEHPESRLLVKEYPTGSISCRNIANYIDELREQRGFVPDVLLVDYLNILKPDRGPATGSASLYEDGKAIAEEMRSLSYKYEIPVVTAVQCNSGGYGNADIGLEHIAQSRAIAHTADFVAALYQDEDDRETGLFRMKIVKSRFGDKKTLKFQFDDTATGGGSLAFRDIDDVDGTAGDSANRTDLKLPGAGKSGPNQARGGLDAQLDPFLQSVMNPGVDLGMP